MEKPIAQPLLRYVELKWERGRYDPLLAYGGVGARVAPPLGEGKEQERGVKGTIP